jgi:hypothetical protein
MWPWEEMQMYTTDVKWPQFDMTSDQPTTSTPSVWDRWASETTDRTRHHNNESLTSLEKLRITTNKPHRGENKNMAPRRDQFSDHVVWAFAFGLLAEKLDFNFWFLTFLLLVFNILIFSHTKSQKKLFSTSFHVCSSFLHSFIAFPKPTQQLGPFISAFIF